MSMSGLRGEIATACPSKHTRQLRFYGSEQESVTPPDLMGILILGNSGYTRQDAALANLCPPARHHRSGCPLSNNAKRKIDGLSLPSAGIYGGLHPFMCSIVECRW